MAAKGKWTPPWMKKDEKGAAKAAPAKKKASAVKAPAKKKK